MGNPLLPPGTVITESDLLLIIGDQTVTIAAMRQKIQDLQEEARINSTKYSSAIKRLQTEVDDEKRRLHDAAIVCKCGALGYKVPAPPNPYEDGDPTCAHRVYTQTPATPSGLCDDVAHNNE